MTITRGRGRRSERRALLLLRWSLGVRLLRRLLAAEARRRRLWVGVVGCVVASLLVPVLRLRRRGTRGSVGAWYRARRLEALARRRPGVVAVVGARVLRLLRRWRHGFVVLCSWSRAVVGVHELGSLLGFGVSVWRVSSQPFVARPVDVRVTCHGFVGSAREEAGESEGEQQLEEESTYAGRASGLYRGL